MKKIISILGVFVILMTIVSATDCRSYFDDVDDIRAELYEDIKILRITADRFYSASDDLEAELDDLDNNDPLTDVSYELDTFVQRSDDVFTDMNRVSEHLADYDDEVSDTRKDIPSECYEVYLNYDDDYDDIKRDFSDVKREWDTFSENIDQIETYSNSPSNYEVSDAESMVKQLTRAIDDYLEEVESMSGPNNTINVGDSFSEEECIAMAEVTLQKERDTWEKECVENVTYINTTCDECVCDDDDCDELLSNEREKLIDCKADKTEIKSKYDSISATVSSCNAKQEDVDQLTEDNEKLDDENTKLRVTVASLNNSLNEYDNVVCEECGPWFWVALALFILMIFGWILAM